MDIGEGKVQFRNHLKHQAQQRRGRKMATATAIIPNIFATAKIYKKYIKNIWPNASMSLYAKPNDICSDPNYESDPSNEYSPLGLTHVMNSIFLDPSNEFLTQAVNIGIPKQTLGLCFHFSK